MTFTSGSYLPGTRHIALASGALFLFLATTILAQDSADDVQIDADIFNLFLSTRIQKPAAQATPEERTGVMNELTDIFLISELPQAKALGEEPQVKAQLELQQRIILFNAFAMDFLAKNQATDQEIFNLYEDQIALEQPPEFKARQWQLSRSFRTVRISSSWPRQDQRDPQVRMVAILDGSRPRKW